MSRDSDINCSNAAITTIPGALATVILFNSTIDPGKGTLLTRRRAFGQVKRITVRILADQIVTVFCEGLGRQSTTYAVVNGAGAGEATTANVLFKRDFNVSDEDDFQIRVTTPAGAITVWDVDVNLSTDRALAQ